MQKQILLDYEEDITKYAGGLDKGKILSVYRKIPAFLGNDNKKFQISFQLKIILRKHQLKIILKKTNSN